MNLSKHKRWIQDYFNENYGCVPSSIFAPVLKSALEIDNKCNFVVEAWDSRLNLWKEQVPFMKKDKFCKKVEVGSDRDGSYCHYKFVFPFDFVDAQVNSKDDENPSQSAILRCPSCTSNDIQVYSAFDKSSSYGKAYAICECCGNEVVVESCNTSKEALHEKAIEQWNNLAKASNSNEMNLISAISYAIGRLDIVPQTNEGKLCVEVKEYLQKALKEISNK